MPSPICIPCRHPDSQARKTTVIFNSALKVTKHKTNPPHSLCQINSAQHLSKAELLVKPAVRLKIIGPATTTQRDAYVTIKYIKINI